MCLVGATIFLATASAPQSPKPCSHALPASLAHDLKAQYPRGKIVTLDMLQQEEKAFFVKDHGNRCPGIVSCDFYGDGHDAYAVVLSDGTGRERTTLVVVARQVGKDHWNFRTLARAGGFPVLWTEPSGEYESVYHDKRFRSKNPVIVLCWYESSAIVYTWTGRKIDKLWISD